MLTFLLLALCGQVTIDDSQAVKRLDAQQAEINRLTLQQADLTARLTALEQAKPEPPKPAPTLEVFDPSADLDYLGSFRPPRTVGALSTGFSSGAIAGANTVIYAHAGNVGSAVYFTMHVPPLSPDKIASTTVEAVIPDITDGHLPPANNLTGAALLDGKVWYTFGQRYTNDGSRPSFGWTDLVTSTSGGPFAQANAHFWRRGGLCTVPKSFAPESLAVGFGGYYSRFNGGSYGPAIAIFDPSTPEKHRQVLAYYDDPKLTYEANSVQQHARHCQRPANYWIDPANDGSWVGISPIEGIGRWTCTDEIGGEDFAGGAFWLDSGLVFLPTLGVGGCGYRQAALKADAKKAYWCIYDPADLRAVLDGTKQPWEPVPRWVEWVSPTGGYGRPAGCCVVGDVLYVCCVGDYRDGVEQYPTVHGWRIK